MEETLEMIEQIQMEADREIKEEVVETGIGYHLDIPEEKE